MILRNKIRSLTAGLTAFSMLGIHALDLPCTAPDIPQQNAPMQAAASEMEMEATNSLGKYLTKAADNSMPDAQAAYRIIAADYDAGAGKARVCSAQSTAAFLKVRFLDEESGTELLTLTADVTASEGAVTELDVDADALSETFLMTAELTGITGQRLSEVFVCQKYTRIMQEISAKDINDFEPEYVVNLDDRDDTNFVVLNADTVMPESNAEQNTLANADFTDGVYTFDHADEEMKTLEPTDYLYIQPNDGQIIAIEVAGVTVDGDTVTVTEKPDSQESVFDFIKIESTAGIGDAEVSKAEPSDTPGYHGELYPDSMKEISADDAGKQYAAHGETAVSEIIPESIGAKLEKKKHFQDSKSFVFEYPNDDEPVTTTGWGKTDLGSDFSATLTLTLGLDITFKFYKSLTYTALDFSISLPLSASLELNAEVGLSKTFESAKFTFPLISGVNIRFTLGVVFKLGCSLTMEAQISPFFTMSYDSDSGKLKTDSGIYSSDTDGFSVELSESIYFGIEFTPKLVAVSEDIACFELPMEAGFEVSVVETLFPDDAVPELKAGQYVLAHADEGEELHLCQPNECLTASITFKWSVSGSVRLLKDIPFLKFSKTIKEFGNEYPLKDLFHISKKAGLGFGSCPNVFYRAKIRIIDENGDPFPDCKLMIDNEKTMTDKYGYGVFYLKANQNYICTIDRVRGTEEYHETLSINMKKSHIDLEQKLGSSKAEDKTTTSAPKPAITTGKVTFCTTTATTANPLYEIEQHGQIGENVYYYLYGDGHMLITGCGDMYNYYDTPFVGFNSKIKSVEIMNQNEKKGITSIGDDVFIDCKNLTDIVIPDTVTRIGKLAFSHCSSLKSIQIPDSVTELGEHVFFNCTSLTAMPEMNGITVLPQATFDGCSAMTSAVITPNIKTLSANAFSGTALRSLVIPETVTQIQPNALSGCKALETLTIPYAATEPQYAASVDACTATSQVGDIFHNSYGTTQYLYDGDYSSFLRGYAIRTITVTGGTCIPEHAFSGLEMVTTINLPETITAIGSLAFCNCAVLDTVNIPDAVTEIGEECFSRCYSLREIPQMKHVKGIPAKAFYDCTALEKAELNDEITFIGANAFCNTMLTELVIPESVTSIAPNALYGCKKLVTLTIPYAATAPEYAAAVDACTATSQVSDIFCNLNGSSGPLYGGDYSSVLSGYAIRTITVTGGTCIPDHAFSGLEMLTTINLPETITAIGKEAFFWCSKLRTMELPEQVTAIGSDAFKYCNSLESIYVYPAACTIYMHKDTLPVQTVIHGWSGSPAQAYADQYSRTFVPFDTVTTASTTDTTTTTTQTTATTTTDVTSTTTETTTTETTTTTTTTVTDTPVPFMPGDVNGDGVLSIDDAVLTRRICMEDRSVVGDLNDLNRALNAADMDQDGLITIFDLLLVLNKLYSEA